MKVYDRAEYKLAGDNSNLKPICEIENTDSLDIDSCIRLNGELWGVCIIGIKEDYIVIRKLGITDLKEAKELFAEDEVTCPYCNQTVESFELDDFEEEYTCSHCGSIFSYQREIKISVTYNMQPISANRNIIELKEQL